MNARQKAKKLKKELDYINSKPLREVYKLINVEGEHLRAYRVVPLEEVERFGEEIIEDEVRHQLSIDFLKYIRENMIVNKDSDIDRLHTSRYSTDIWVSFGRR
jgi:hypothetical protein